MLATQIHSPIQIIMRSNEFIIIVTNNSELCINCIILMKWWRINEQFALCVTCALCFFNIFWFLSAFISIVFSLNTSREWESDEWYFLGICIRMRICNCLLFNFWFHVCIQSEPRNDPKRNQEYTEHSRAFTVSAKRFNSTFFSFFFIFWNSEKKVFATSYKHIYSEWQILMNSHIKCWLINWICHFAKIIFAYQLNIEKCEEPKKESNDKYISTHERMEKYGVCSIWRLFSNFLYRNVLSIHLHCHESQSEE